MQTQTRHSDLFLIQQPVPAACLWLQYSQIIIQFVGKQPPLWPICHDFVLFPLIWRIWWWYGGGGLQGFHTVFSHLLLNIQVVVHFCHGDFVLTAHKRTRALLFLASLSLERNLQFPPPSPRVIRVFGTNTRSCSEHLTKITVGREPKSRHAWRKCIQASHVSRVSAQDAPRLRGDTGRPVTTLLRLHPCHLTSSSPEVCSPSTLPQHASLPARQTQGPSSLLHRFYLIYSFVLLFLVQSRAERSQRGLWNTLCTGSKLIYTLRRR